MSIISGPFLCFECSNPKKEIIINVHRLYDNKEDALGYKDVSTVDLGDNCVRIQELWCHDCISRFHTTSRLMSLIF
jgi:hypothetical protein